MITPLDVRAHADAIIGVLRSAYAVEAALLNVNDLPPMRRTRRSLDATPNHFFGVWDETRLVGVMEMEHNNPWQIASLAVLPSHFRRGIGRAFVQHALDHYGPHLQVQTGNTNAPALKLYEDMGFTQSYTFKTSDGIRMIALSC